MAGRGRAYISLLNPHVSLPYSHRVAKCDACGTERVCREGPFAPELYRHLWLCYRPDDADCCWAKAQGGNGNGAQA